MEKANYLQVLPGGHCYICHKDYEEFNHQHSCTREDLSLENVVSKITQCTEECYKTSKFMKKPLTDSEAKDKEIAKLIKTVIYLAAAIDGMMSRKRGKDFSEMTNKVNELLTK